MAYPGISSPADTHVDVVLTNLVLGYGKPEMIAEKILPTLSVQSDTGIFYEWVRNNINLGGLQFERADRAKAAEVNLDLTKQSYSVVQYALRDFLEDGIRKNADSILSLQATYAQNVVDLMDLNREVQTAAAVFASGSYAADHVTTLTSTNRWGIDIVNSDPRADIAAAKQKVLLDSGVMPNTLVIGYPLFQKLRRHAKLLASLQYVAKTGGDFVTGSDLAAYLEVPNIIVGEAVANTAAEGLTANTGFVWDSHALLYYTPPTGGGINVPAFGYNFVPGHTPRTVSRYELPDYKGEFIEVNEKRAPKICFKAAGYLFLNANV